MNLNIDTEKLSWDKYSTLSCDNLTIHTWTKQFIRGLENTKEICGTGKVEVTVMLSGLRSFISLFNPEFADNMWPIVMGMSKDERLKLLNDYIECGEIRFPVREYTATELSEIEHKLHRQYPAMFSNDVSYK